MYDESEAATTRSRFELVQLLVEAEADPTSVAVGITKQPRSSFELALDRLDLYQSHARHTSLMQVGTLVKGCDLCPV
jgi:hypothetical protein